jgi:hypothetical protein
MTDPDRALVNKTARVQPIPMAFVPIMDSRRPIIEHCPYCHAPLIDTEDQAEHSLRCQNPPDPEPDPDDDPRS